MLSEPAPPVVAQSSSSSSMSANAPIMRTTELCVVLSVLLLSGSVNFVLLKCLYAEYGEEQAFFVSTGINVLFVVYGGVIVYPRLLPCGLGNVVSTACGLDPITPQMRRPAHQRRFLAMGAFDTLGTFLTAMGAVYTPGQLQPLLNQSLIPATMVCSRAFLGTRYSRGQLLAAVLLICGAALSVLPKVLQPSGAHPDDETRGYAVLLYWLSNLPMACSAVYKEARFTREPMDVTYLTQWVSIWQMLLGLALAPLQMLPGVGSADGQSWPSIVASFAAGLDCFLGRGGEHAARGACVRGHGSPVRSRPTVLLLSYVAINFVFNTLGLYLTKHGGAVLNSISYSLLLPITTALFSLPLLGPYRESAHLSTYAGLLVVLAGFGLWRYCELQSDKRPTTGKPAGTKPPAGVVGDLHALEEPLLRGAVPPAVITVVPPLAADACGASPAEAASGVPLFACAESDEPGGAPMAASPPHSFQERVIGMGRVASAGYRAGSPAAPMGPAADSLPPILPRNMRGFRRFGSSSSSSP